MDMSTGQKDILDVDLNRVVELGDTPIDLGYMDDTPVRLHPVKVSNEFETSRFDQISFEADRLSAMGYYGDASLDSAIGRKRKSSIDYGNPATKELLEIVDGVRRWLDLVPTAAALHPIYNPEVDRLPNGHPMTDDLRHWLGNLYDGIGIRSRAEVVSSVLSDEAVSLGGGGRWVSLACGAAQPVIGALERVKDSSLAMPEVTLVDYDKTILSLASSYAEDAGLNGRVQTKRMNVLSRNGLASSSLMNFAAKALGARGRLQPGVYDTVEAVGILEYLKRDDWRYVYHGVIDQRQKMAGAITFIKNAYELVKPGGLLLVGNMLDTHPQLGFTLNVVQWPHIQPRSLDEMLDIFDEASIDMAELDIYRPDDGVYALYAIRKP